jgi:hypothetical protein
MVSLNASAFVVLTGNGLTVSEDLARRFIAVDFDPLTENPESRTFDIDILAEVQTRRSELLSALLTIWRYGQQTRDLARGRTLGSFEQWGRWVRDPLLALGCQDPVERINEAKSRDSRRQMISSLFTLWSERYGEESRRARDLDEDIRQVLDPHARGRQTVVWQLERLAGTRLAGFIMTRQEPAGPRGVATYALKQTSAGGNHAGGS